MASTDLRGGVKAKLKAEGRSGVPSLAGRVGSNALPLRLPGEGIGPQITVSPNMGALVLEAPALRGAGRRGRVLVLTSGLVMCGSREGVHTHLHHRTSISRSSDPRIKNAARVRQRDQAAKLKSPNPTNVLTKNHNKRVRISEPRGTKRQEIITHTESHNHNIFEMVFPFFWVRPASRRHCSSNHLNDMERHSCRIQCPPNSAIASS